MTLKSKPARWIPAVALIAAVAMCGSAEGQNNKKNQPYYSPSYGLYKYGQTWKFPQQQQAQQKPQPIVRNYYVLPRAYPIYSPYGYSPYGFYRQNATRSLQRNTRAFQYSPYSRYYARPYGW
ncbi:MAG: hypothetical protein AAFU85_00030 [Planctomycetota bacterium]